MPHPDPKKPVPVAENPSAPDGTKKPSTSDVREQRQKPQQEEAVVEKSNSRPPTQSLIDQERGDWEGMGQGASLPD